MNEEENMGFESEDIYAIKTYSSASEIAARRAFVEHFKSSPIPDDQLLSNMGLFLSSKALSRILFMNHLYEQIVDVMGVVMEFGTRWGPNLGQFAALRGIYEPFNRHRKIIGFDTFSGFPKIDSKDGDSDMMEVGHLTVPEGYKEYLEKALELQERDNPLSHIRKFELCAGDATKTLPKYLSDNPETIVALAYFDFDVYEPTKICLEAIKPRLVKGSVLGFDELNDPDSPGETLALMEVFGLNNIKLKRYPYASRTSYFVVE
jgi:hypothetical protein